MSEKFSYFLAAVNILKDKIEITNQNFKICDKNILYIFFDKNIKNKVLATQTCQCKLFYKYIQTLFCNYSTASF